MLNYHLFICFTVDDYYDDPLNEEAMILHIQDYLRDKLPMDAIAKSEHISMPDTYEVK